MLSPAQSAPPFLGAGLEHDLDREAVAEPQVGLHAVQSPQAVQPPSTGSPCSAINYAILKKT